MKCCSYYETICKKLAFYYFQSYYSGIHTTESTYSMFSFIRSSECMLRPFDAAGFFVIFFYCILVFFLKVCPFIIASGLVIGLCLFCSYPIVFDVDIYLL